MTNVFGGLDALLDTPATVPTWTVQSPATGSNQNTVGVAGVTGGLITSKAAHQTPVGTIADNTQATVQGIAAKLDAINAALVSAGIEA